MSPYQSTGNLGGLATLRAVCLGRGWTTISGLGALLWVVPQLFQPTCLECPQIGGTAHICTTLTPNFTHLAIFIFAQKQQGDLYKLFLWHDELWEDFQTDFTEYLMTTVINAKKFINVHDMCHAKLMTGSCHSYTPSNSLTKASHSERC